MRVMLWLATLAMACGTREERGKPAALPPDGAPPPDAEPAPKAVMPAPLPEVQGATTEAGKALFVKLCTGCHGEGGRGDGVRAKDLRLAPTDLTTPNYFCRTTNGRPVAVPSDQDVEGALERGSHKGWKELAALDAAQRRSLTLHVKTLSVEFQGAPQAILDVPPEPPVDAAALRRGRIVYLAFGCWRCHGVDTGGDGPGVSVLAWNGKKFDKLLPLKARDQHVCGGSPRRMYETIALGIGQAPHATPMPGYQRFAEEMAQPDKLEPKDWVKGIEGKAPAEDVTAVKGWYGELPKKMFVAGMKPSEKRARAAGFLWDLVHYLQSL